MERTSEELDLLKRLNIKDFRHLKAKHALELASSLKELSPEVQLKIIEQVPNFTNFISATISTCKNEIDTILKTNNDELIDVFSSYNSIMNSLQNILDTDESLSFEQKMELINAIGTYADKKSDLHIQEQLFKEKILNKLFAFSAICVATVVGLLGVNTTINNHRNDEDNIHEDDEESSVP